MNMGALSVNIMDRGLRGEAHGLRRAHAHVHGREQVDKEPDAAQAWKRHWPSVSVKRDMMYAVMSYIYVLPASAGQIWSQMVPGVAAMVGWCRSVAAELAHCDTNKTMAATPSWGLGPNMSSSACQELVSHSIPISINVAKPFFRAL